MKKRMIATALAFLLFMNIPFFASADGTDPQQEDMMYPVTTVTAAEVQDIPAPSAILMDADSGRVLFEKNADEALPPASITKIMTMLLVMDALENGQITLDDPVTCSEHASSMGGSQIWLEVGETMTVDELLRATAVASANDAAMALAEYVAGSESEFVARMNEKAKELGMENTNFVNPTGLDADGHTSSARDIALMSRALLSYDAILPYTSTWMDTLRNGETELTNTNRLVRHYEGCTGLKTGTTDGAGSCLSASASRNGVNLIAVCMGASTSDDRFSACRTLLDYGFSAFEAFLPERTPEEPKETTVRGGVQETVPLIYEEVSSVLIPKGRSGDVQKILSLSTDYEAPVAAGDTVGKVEYLLDGETILSLSITAGEEVEALTLSTTFFLFLKLLIGK